MSATKVVNEFFFMRVLESKDARTRSLQWLPANEVFPSSEHTVQDMSICTFPCGKYQLRHISFEEAIKHLSEITAEEGIEEADVLHSDLVTGKYEGLFSQY